MIDLVLKFEHLTAMILSMAELDADRRRPFCIDMNRLDRGTCVVSRSDDIERLK
jgi:hypothetical protein